MKTKVTREQLAELIGLDISEGSDKTRLERSQKGVFTRRMEYYWRPKRTPEECFQKMITTLTEKGFKVNVIEYGDHYTSFKGSQGVKKNSHYFVKFTVEAA